MPHSLIPASYVVLLRGRPGFEEVLLHRRSNTGYRDGHWAVPAGHVALHESPMDAAAREAYEEVGARIHRDALVPVTAMHRSTVDAGPVEQRVDFFFVARAWVGEPSIREPGRSAALSWFDLRVLPDPCVPHERLVLDAIAAGAPTPAIVSGGETGA